MAGNECQKPLLTLIRDFTTEKSHGERRIMNQKKQIDELRSDLEASTKDLEESKRDKENKEQELKCYEVELSRTDASIKALEARVALTNNEILKLSSELAAIKSEENITRNGFIEKMLELNLQIRKFQELAASTFNSENYSEATLIDGSSPVQEQYAQKTEMDLQNELAQITMQISQKEEEYKAEQIMNDQLQSELTASERKALLLESIMKESRELQELHRQTSTLEEHCGALGDELQKRFLCSRCNQDNSEELAKILQMNS